MTESTQRNPETLREWFDAAFELAPEARTSWLDTHCHDAVMRSRVCTLLDAAVNGDEDMLAQVHGHFADIEALAGVAAAGNWVGKYVGSYLLDQCIGEGGMSVVYRAHAASQVRRTVAVKILRIGMHAEDRQKAFRREREALAKLDHPNIARLIDGGISEGTPYLVIEYVDGQPLTTHARAEALDLRARLALFATMCRAVEAAHRLLIVHRDLKPSNVLVTRDGQVKLLDFGIAKLLDADEPTTRTTRVALTPDYAAPEQFTNDPVSTATDVFALGVILHELLTGVRPERGWTTRPSVIVTRLGDADLPPGLHLRPLRAGLVGDLDNVILKAIDPDPERRYGSAGAFADDIERHLSGQPVAAYPPSRWYRTRKFVQRHRGAVSVTASLALGVVVSLGIAIHQGRQAAAQAQAAQVSAASARTESARANAVRDYLLGIFKSAQEQLPEGQRPTPQQLVQAAAATLESSNGLDNATRAALYAAYADINSTMSEHADAAKAYARAADLLEGQSQHRRDWLVYRLRQAFSLNSDGHNGDAVKLAEPLIAELRGAPDLASVTGLVAWVDILVGAGRFDDAIAMADEVAERASHLPDRDSPEARFRTLLPGWTRANAGHPVDAVERLQPALDAWRASSTPKDSEYASGLATLAFSLYHMGRRDEARALLEEALALSRTIYKAPHERLAGMLVSLSTAEVQQGHVDAAARYAEEANAMYTALFGPAHPKVLSGRLALATIDWERKGIAHAIAEYRAITELCTSSGQETSNPGCARTWQNLSNALLHAKHLDQALQANDKSLALRRALFGEDHIEYATTMAGRGAILAGMKRYDEAMTWNDRALAVYVRNGADQNITVADLQRNRSLTLLNMGRFDDALAAVDASATIFERFADTDAARNADMHGLRALIHAAAGHLDRARAEATQAVKLDPALSKCRVDDRPKIHALAAAR